MGQQCPRRARCQPRIAIRCLRSGRACKSLPRKLLDQRHYLCGSRHSARFATALCFQYQGSSGVPAGRVGGWRGHGREHERCLGVPSNFVVGWRSLVATFPETCGVTIIDSCAGYRYLWIGYSDFMTLVRDENCLTNFRLTSTPASTLQHEAYELRGRGPNNSTRGVQQGPTPAAALIRTPLTSCAKCKSVLAPADPIAARLYTLDGVKEDNHIPMRCALKSCRVPHLFNYRKQGGRS